MTQGDFEQRMDFLMRSQESLHANLDRLYATVSDMARASQQDAENIRALARIPQSRENRISKLEEGQSPS